MTILIIILLACITFTTRYLFIHPSIPLTLGARAQKFLSYSAPTVLTAIWVPIIVTKNHQLTVSLTNPYLWGATLAILVAWKTKSIYYTAFSGGALFVLLKVLL